MGATRASSAIGDGDENGNDIAAGWDASYRRLAGDGEIRPGEGVARRSLSHREWPETRLEVVGETN